MDWADRLSAEGVKAPLNWKEPKAAHKKMMQAFLQSHVSIIFCLRADEKIEVLRENGKTVIRPLGWMPICEKRFLYEMTASFTLTPDRPGIPHFDLPHKLQSQHRAMFSDKEPIGEESGRLLAEWASGGSAAPALSPPTPAGAADVYFERWTAIMNGATNSEQLAKKWNDEAEERKSIAWTDEHSFNTLKTKVGAAIKFLKQPA